MIVTSFSGRNQITVGCKDDDDDGEEEQEERGKNMKRKREKSGKTQKRTMLMSKKNVFLKR